MIEQLYRHIILPGFERGWKGRKTFQYGNQLEASQWWTPLQLKQWQLKNLRALLQYCQQHSAYYRETWKQENLQPDSIRSLEDFALRWPVTTRDTMRQQQTRIRSSETRLRQVAKSTGGSSGKPLQLTIDLDANDRRVSAAYRGYSWAGAYPGTSQTHLWGVDLKAKSRRSKYKDWLYSRFLHRRDMLNSFDLSPEAMEAYVSRMNRYRPRVLVAYTNPLYAWAKFIDERKLTVHRPKSIVVGAEKLHSFQRQTIERVFESTVFETYGSREFTLIGAECDQHKGLHVTSELLLVEIVDDAGHPVEAGEEGNIVVTDLFNHAMPFIRYAIGDRGIASAEPCPCGRGLPLIKEVVGRQLDILIAPNGRQIPGEFFPHLMKDFPAIEQYQVTQPQPNRLLIKLVVNATWNDTKLKRLNEKIELGLCRSNLGFSIQHVDSIPLTKAGKRRVVVGYEPSQKPAALSA
ncbi:MAG: phenylacetate--CoA ligase family protein [Planctomycetota bacterium]